MNDTIKTLSLFSGAGGLDIGFHKAGFDIVGCVEIEQQYCNTLIANRDAQGYFNPQAKIYCQDIRTFNPSEFSEMGIECVIGGPPCQPFSAAGRRAGGVPGMQDERGMLFESYCHVLEVLHPKVFVFENVYGLKGANDGEAWNEIVTAFSQIGYTIDAEILDAADYGVPQHRERLILVGHLEGDFMFPEPTHGPDSSSGKELVSIWDAINDIQIDEDETENIGGMYGHLLPLVPEGLNYSFFTKEMGYPEPYFAWRSKFHDFLYKADRNKPCRTLKAQPGKFTGPFHWKNRHFTIAELKRIQSFPDNYEITGTNTQIIAQIGNSVPPRLAEVLAISVKEQLLRPQNVLTYPVREPGFVSTFRRRQRESSEYYKTVASKEIEKRFGVINENETQIFAFLHRYYIGFATKFNSSLFTRKPTAKQLEKLISAYKVVSECKNENIEIVIDSCVDGPCTGEIQITGLKKYLIKVDTVSVRFSIACEAEIFEVWSIIQKELVDMSQFYSLIDIYGHYANRGDTVGIKTAFDLNQDNPFIRALDFFGDSNNCGIYMSKEDVAEKIQIPIEDVDDFVMEMRGLRFDVRTTYTHRTIRTDAVICTYPFPMLSERVMFDRKYTTEG